MYSDLLFHPISYCNINDVEIQYYVRLWHNQWLVILECFAVFIQPDEF